MFDVGADDGQADGARGTGAYEDVEGRSSVDREDVEVVM